MAFNGTPVHDFLSAAKIPTNRVQKLLIALSRARLLRGAHSISLTVAWLDVHYELVHLLSPSRLEVKGEGRWVRDDKDHVCQTCRGTQGPKPWRIFDVPGDETATRLPSTTAWRHHRALRHDYQPCSASLFSATSIVGYSEERNNYTTTRATLPWLARSSLQNRLWQMATLKILNCLSQCREDLPSEYAQNAG